MAGFIRLVGGLNLLPPTGLGPNDRWWAIINYGLEFASGQIGTIGREARQIFQFIPTDDQARGESLIQSKANPQEIVLLRCARLDALASCMSREDQSNRQSFIHLLVNYSGHRDLMQSVSVGDLYYELGYHRWLTEGLIPKPGRLHRFSRLNDPVLSLLDRSGISLTVEFAEGLFTRLMRALSTNFRCSPSQPTRKPMTGKSQFVAARMLAEFQKSQDAELLQKLGQALQPLLETKTLAGLLYEKFRNNAIHCAWVEFDEEAFFGAHQPYLGTFVLSPLSTFSIRQVSCAIPG